MQHICGFLILIRKSFLLSNYLLLSSNSYLLAFFSFQSFFRVSGISAQFNSQLTCFFFPPSLRSRADPKTFTLDSSNLRLELKIQIWNPSSRFTLPVPFLSFFFLFLFLNLSTSSIQDRLELKFRSIRTKILESSPGKKKERVRQSDGIWNWRENEIDGK